MRSSETSSPRRGRASAARPFARSLCDSLESILDCFREAESRSDHRGRFELRGDFAVDLAGGVAALAQSRGWRLRELAESPFSLEDTFIALTKQAGGSEDMHLPGRGRELRA